MNQALAYSKSLLLYFLGGLAIFCADTFGSFEFDEEKLAKYPPSVEGKYARDSSETLLLEEAFRRGLHLKDPVIYQHIVRNMRLQSDADYFSNPVLFAQALEIGLLQSDSVVRSRLLYVMRQKLAAVRSTQYPTRSALQQFVRNTSPERYAFSHLVFRESFRGESTESDAVSTLELLSSRPNLDYSTLGDPLMNARTAEVMTGPELTQKYGAQFFAHVRQAKIGVWQKPIKSRFGFHLIRIDRFVPAQVKRLEEVENQARGRLLRQIESSNLQDALKRLELDSQLFGTRL